ncbi:hypothetical protein, partial [Aeromonas salmonicida]|uniref:hypothetical protein n=1 Tax=Aeromonas salmonicida TaxID=645 RepID=UPI001A907B94
NCSHRIIVEPKSLVFYFLKSNFHQFRTELCLVVINPFDIIAIVNQRGLIKVIHHSAVKPVLHSYRT